MQDFIKSWFVELYAVAVCVAAVLPGELFTGPEKHSWVSRVRGVTFYAIYLFFFVLGGWLAHAFVRWTGRGPLFSFDFVPSNNGNPFWRFLLTVPLAFLPPLLFDIFYYWFHRMQHAVPFLWRFHAVHHSIEEMSIANCHHHWSEGLWQAAILLVPIALLIELRVAEIAFIGTVLGFWTMFVHANSRIDFGPFRYFMVSPAFHRVHHSTQRTHFDKNFAGLFPLLDVIFGTAYFPKPDQKIKTGLADKHEPRTLWEYAVALRLKVGV